jgi:hypothetical protein
MGGEGEGTGRRTLRPSGILTPSSAELPGRVGDPNPDYGGRTALRWRVRAAGRQVRDLARLPQPSRAVANSVGLTSVGIRLTHTTKQRTRNCEQHQGLLGSQPIPTETTTDGM